MRKLVTASVITIILMTALSMMSCSTGSDSKVDRATESDLNIFADTTYHDLGKIAHGDIVCVNNTLTNPCSQTIGIREVSTDCSCTQATVDKTEIKAGEKATLRIEFDTHGNVGRQYHLVSVETTTGKTIKICIYAEVCRTKY